LIVFYVIIVGTLVHLILLLFHLWIWNITILYYKHWIYIIKVFPLTDAQLDSLKKNINSALKSTLKSSYMFQCKTPSSGSTLSEPC